MSIDGFRSALSILVMGISVAAISCGTQRAVNSRSAKGSPFEPTLAYVEFADPVRDVREAFAAGDHRFVAVGGLGLNIPYLDANRPDLVSRVGHKIVIGSSDAPRTYWEEKANAVARVYAENYNLLLYERLMDSGKLPAPPPEE